MALILWLPGFCQGVSVSTYSSGEPRIPDVFGQEQIHFAVLTKNLSVGFSVCGQGHFLMLFLSFINLGITVSAPLTLKADSEDYSKGLVGG